MTTQSYALPARLHLRNLDNAHYSEWEQTMFKTPEMPLADRVEKATTELEAWFASGERARLVEQIHLAEQQPEQVAS